jgi:hypothetical protein
MIRIAFFLFISFLLWACGNGNSGSQAQKETIDFAALGFTPDISGLWWRIAESRSAGDSIRIGDSVRFLMKVNLVDGSPVSSPQSEGVSQKIRRWVGL